MQEHTVPTDGKHLAVLAAEMTWGKPRRLWDAEEQVGLVLAAHPTTKTFILGSSTRIILFEFYFETVEEVDF